MGMEIRRTTRYVHSSGDMIGSGSAPLAEQEEAEQSRPGHTSLPRTPPPLSRACRAVLSRAV